MSQKRVALQLIACPSADGWAVDILKDGVTVRRDVLVRDPLNQDQRSTCRWYLEEFVEKLPFSEDRAKEAELLLGDYPEDLLKQLLLREIMVPDFEDAPLNRDSVLLSINVCQGSDNGGCSVDTIHSLYWELLEDPELWCHPRLVVVVQRSVVMPHIDQPSPSNSLSCWKQLDGSLTINVLVVIARKITQSSSMYDDVSPFVATDALIKVQKWLVQAGSPIQLRLEIVRPGTFDAFVDHLERARTIHGKNGYFHVVHFDMHGTMITRKGSSTKYASLQFSKEGSQSTTPVPGKTVGKILKQFEVSFAVMNACESARPCLGDEGNIAQQFLKQGVKSVLGMSFKVAANAAATFLEAFYHDLLIQGGSFAEAAAVGRHTLRMNPMRPARYNRQQRRQDSIVAVTYGPALNFASIQPADPWQQPLTDETNLFSRFYGIRNMPLKTSISIEEGLYGRDFDLLRLEWLLQQTYCVYLYGQAGVGKSVFLDRAVSLWRSTHFVEAVVSIDFFKDQESSKNVILTILHQLLSQVHDHKYQIRFWTIPSRLVQSFDDDMAERIVAEILSDIDAIVVLDGLDIPLMPPPPHLTRSVDQTSITQLCQSMKSLLAISQNCYKKKLRLVFTARRSDSTWLETLIDYRFQPLLYELKGLDLASAIDLSHLVLQTCGEDTLQWTYEDTDHLVAIIQLLECNPSALLGVLPLQQALKITWRLFYGRLHHGLFASVAELEQVEFGGSRFCQEIKQASLSFRRDHFFFLCLFALYWNEAVTVDVIYHIFSQMANEPVCQDLHVWDQPHPRKEFTSMLQSFALDRGYLRLGNDEVRLRLHPLFTIVGRAYLPAFITPEAGIQLRAMFCSSVESLCFKSDLHKQGLVIWAANILTCMNDCLIDVPPKSWPLELFSILVEPTLSSVLPRALCYMSLEQMFQFLMLLSTKVDRLEQKERYLEFLLLVLLRVISTLENSSQTWERASEFSSIGLSLLPSLDRRIVGRIKAQLYQCCLLLVQMVSCLALRDNTGQKRSWPATIRIKDEWYQITRLESSLFLDPEDPDFIFLGIHGIRCIVQEIRNTPVQDLELSDACKLIVDATANLIEPTTEPLATSFLSRDMNQPSATASERFANEASGDIEISQYKKMLGFDERRIQQIPMAKTQINRDRNKTLENSYETGDWMDSLACHEAMAMEAWDGYRFEEADQHLESMRAILIKVSAPAKFLDVLNEKKEAVRANYKRYLFQYNIYQMQQDSGAPVAESPMAQSSLEESDLTYENMTVTKSEYRESPQKWWEWWEWYLSSGSSWVVKVFASDSKYKKQVKLMTAVHSACRARDLDTALPLLRQLEAICRGGIFVEGKSRAPPMPTDERAKAAIYQYQKIQSWRAAVDKDDFKLAKALLGDLSASVHLVPTCFIPSLVGNLYIYTDRERLIKFTLEFHAADKAGNLSSCQALYCEFLELVDKGELSRIRPEEILGLRYQALGMLMQQTVKLEQWNDGLLYCREYLILSKGLRKSDLESREACLQIKEICEWELAEDALKEAEARLDFQKCIDAVDVKQKLYETQKATAGRARTRFVFQEPKITAFRKGSYRDQCLGCIRWARRETPDQCTFPREKGPNHDRSIFRMPFGCPHHCKGGYCLSM